MDKAERLYKKAFMDKKAKMFGPLALATTAAWFLPRPNNTVLNLKNMNDKVVKMKNLVKLPKVIK